MRIVTRKFKPGELLPSVVLVLYFCVIAYLTRGLGPLSRIFPLIVITGALIVGAIQIMTVINEKAYNLFPARGIEDGIGGKKEKPKVLHDKGSKRKREMLSIGWIILFVLLYLVVGTLTALVIAPLIVMRFYGKVRWRTSILVTGFTWVFIYLVFVQFIKTTFPMGMLWRW